MAVGDMGGGGAVQMRTCRHNKPIFILSTRSLQVVVVEQILKICRRRIQDGKETRRVRISLTVSQNPPTTPRLLTLDQLKRLYAVSVAISSTYVSI